MPIYEYKCKSCSTQFELFIRGDEVANCPDGCGADVEKQLSVTASPCVSGKSAFGMSLPVRQPVAGGG